MAATRPPVRAYVPWQRPPCRRFRPYRPSPSLPPQTPPLSVPYVLPTVVPAGPLAVSGTGGGCMMAGGMMGWSPCVRSADPLCRDGAVCVAPSAPSPRGGVRGGVGGGGRGPHRRWLAPPRRTRRTRPLRWRRRCFCATAAQLSPPPRPAERPPSPWAAAWGGGAAWRGHALACRALFGHGALLPPPPSTGQAPGRLPGGGAAADAAVAVAAAAAVAAMLPVECGDPGGSGARPQRASCAPQPRDHHGRWGGERGWVWG